MKNRLYQFGLPGRDFGFYLHTNMDSKDLEFTIYCMRIAFFYQKFVAAVRPCKYKLLEHKPSQPPTPKPCDSATNVPVTVAKSGMNHESDGRGTAA